MTAAATTVTFTYEAKVTEISNRLLGGPLGIGDRIIGSYMVDSNTAVADIQKWGPNSEWSQTFFEGALKSSSARIGTELFKFETGFVRTDPNTTGKTAYSTYTRGAPSYASTPVIGGLNVNGIAIAFSPYPTSFPLNYLPLDLPPFSEQDNPATFVMFFGQLGNDAVVGKLTATNYSSSMVPEPSSALLLFAGGALMLIYSKSNRARAVRNRNSSSDA